MNSDFPRIPNVRSAPPQDGSTPPQEPRESRVVQEVRLALGRDPRVVLWRLSQGAFRLADGTTRRFGLAPGACDLVGLLVGTGRLFALEVKTRTGRVSDDQRKWIDLVNRCGGFARVVRSADEARWALGIACDMGGK